MHVDCEKAGMHWEWLRVTGHALRAIESKWAEDLKVNWVERSPRNVWQKRLSEIQKTNVDSALKTEIS